jgi:hypothetical protein
MLWLVLGGLTIADRLEYRHRSVLCAKHGAEVQSRFAVRSLILAMDT